jgi:hypothetical protein
MIFWAIILYDYEYPIPNQRVNFPFDYDVSKGGLLSHQEFSKDS